MGRPWPALGLALLGCVAGAILGWAIGRVYRGRPVNALLAVVVAFVGACWALVYAARTGDSWVASVGLGVAFGVMTMVKYSSGLLLGTGTAPHGAPVPECEDAGAAGGEDGENAA